MAKNLKTFIPIAPPVGAAREGNLYTFSHANYDNNTIQAARYNPTNAFRNVWIVPTGITTARFELWGGGGAGAGATCCMQGIHAGSGAYAYKNLSVTAGSRYTLCLGDVMGTTVCRYNNIPANGTNDINCDCGTRGANVSVTGDGLANLCAEGGNPGATRWRAYYNGPNTGRNEILNYCDILCREVSDSAGDLFHRACYYGADGGYRGVHSYTQMSCCGCLCKGQDYWCGMTPALAYPGGLWEKQGRAACGGVMQTQTNMNTQEGFGPFGTNQSQKMLSVIDGNWNNNGNNIGIRGVGGLSAGTKAGTCCCGSFGAPGAIYITYS